MFSHFMFLICILHIILNPHFEHWLYYVLLNYDYIVAVISLTFISKTSILVNGTQYVLSTWKKHVPFPDETRAHLHISDVLLKPLHPRRVGEGILTTSIYWWAMVTLPTGRQGLCIIFIYFKIIVWKQILHFKASTLLAEQLHVSTTQRKYLLTSSWKVSTFFVTQLYISTCSCHITEDVLTDLWSHFPLCPVTSSRAMSCSYAKQTYQDTPPDNHPSSTFRTLPLIFPTTLSHGHPLTFYVCNPYSRSPVYSLPSAHLLLPIHPSLAPSFVLPFVLPHCIIHLQQPSLFLPLVLVTSLFLTASFPRSHPHFYYLLCSLPTSYSILLLRSPPPLPQIPFPDFSGSSVLYRPDLPTAPVRLTCQQQLEV